MEGINERQMKIITTLNESGFVKVVNLCQQFDVSPVTIRKDLNFLEKKGLLFRTHGGAANNRCMPLSAISRRRNDCRSSRKNA